jgi:Filament-like plant protein, long coiled-coil
VYNIKDSQISSASEKLAECQETIVSIGQQLKLLASPIDTPLFDKIDTPVSKEEITPGTRNPKHTAVQRNLEVEFNAAESSHKSGETPPKVQLGTLALVPKRQPEGTNLLRKLLMRRKRESFKKLAMPVGA